LQSYKIHTAGPSVRRDPKRQTRCELSGAHFSLILGSQVRIFLLVVTRTRLKCATTGIRQWPNFVALQRIAAACYAKSGRVEDAKRAWFVALQLDPTQRLSNLRGQTLFRKNDFEKFAEAYRIMGMPE
jgi:hypothetical protein